MVFNYSSSDLGHCSSWHRHIQERLPNKKQTVVNQTVTFLVCHLFTQLLGMLKMIEVEVWERRDTPFPVPFVPVGVT